MREKKAAYTETVCSDGNRDKMAELLAYFFSKWKLILLMAMVGLALAIIYAFGIATPQYEATTTLFVNNRSDSVIDFSDFQIGKALTYDYIKVFNMWEVHEQVIENLNLPYDYDQMRSRLKVVNAANTRMLDITFRSASPQEAADVANEYAIVGSEYITEMMQTEKPTVISSALVPVNPVSPNKAGALVLGTAAGLMCAIAVLFCRFARMKMKERMAKKKKKKAI